MTSALLVLSITGFVLALIPAVNFALNWPLFRRLVPRGPESQAIRRPVAVSVLIPARNEGLTISSAIESVLANQGLDFEVVVLDDHSDDDTAARVREWEQRDSRVRLASAPPLPPGWCGKPHACQVLAGLARHDYLIWMDADVRLELDALRRIADEMATRPIDLLSGFPREVTGSWLEVLMIPLIHFVLLGYLPLWAMRRVNGPGLGAGCGQLFIARRATYEKVGGHAAIRATLHDGLALPRLFRRAGRTTDLFDASDLASCRMYRSASEVWMGLLKNAGEGLATPGGIGPWTLLLGGSQVLPPVLTLILLQTSGNDSRLRWALSLSVASLVLSLAVRLAAAVRYRQPYFSVLGHPVGVLLLLAIQWQSLILRVLGKSRTWKGRTYGVLESTWFTAPQE